MEVLVREVKFDGTCFNVLFNTVLIKCIFLTHKILQSNARWPVVKCALLTGTALTDYMSSLQSLRLFFFRFFNLGPVCLRSGFKHCSLVACCGTLNYHSTQTQYPCVSYKETGSLIEAVLISFGLANSFPKML